MATAIARIVVQATAQDKKAIAAKAKRLKLPISELMRRGAFAYEPDEADEELGALADSAKAAADRAGRRHRQCAGLHRGERQAHRGDGGRGAQGICAKESPMSITDRVWGALTSMVKLEDKVDRQAEAMKVQQQRIEDLTGRVIRLEAQLELLTGAALVKRLKGD